MYQVKIVLSNNHSTTRIPTGVYVLADQFVQSRSPRPITYKNPMHVEYNDRIEQIYRDYDNAIYEMERSGEIRFASNKDIRAHVDKQKAFASIRTFWDVADMIRSEATKPKTADMYRYMGEILDRFLDGHKQLLFEHITPLFLTNLINFMNTCSNAKGGTGLSKSTQGIVMRSMRVIYNRAIQMKIVDAGLYPFKQVRMPKSKQKKGYIALDDLRKVRDARLDPGSHEDMARDLFMLSFYLCGTNPIDIWKMEPASGGYVSYERTKTEDRNPEQITMRLLPEALTIVQKWAGQDRLMVYSEKYASYDSFYSAMRKRMRKVFLSLDIEDMSFYSARRAWATYAIHEDVPEYVVDKSLQHADTTIASKHYIIYDWRKTDRANRIVRDFVASDRGWDEDEVAW